MNIKMVALDLDGTLLAPDKSFSEYSRNVLEEAARRGIYVVISTGRPVCALPADVLDMECARYVITSNGANVIDTQDGRTIYSNCIEPDAADRIIDTLIKYSSYGYMTEVFINGQAYYDESFHEKIFDMGYSEARIQYILTTRKRVRDLFGFFRENRDRIENVNVNFSDMETRAAMRPYLETLEGVTLTTSFPHNWELGGRTTSKADALSELCGRLGFSLDNVMACGDSMNDSTMLSACGLSVAMGNADPELKNIADHVVDDNAHDGAAKAVKTFVLSDFS